MTALATYGVKATGPELQDMMDGKPPSTSAAASAPTKATPTPEKAAMAPPSQIQPSDDAVPGSTTHQAGKTSGGVGIGSSAAKDPQAPASQVPTTAAAVATTDKDTTASKDAVGAPVPAPSPTSKSVPAVEDADMKDAAAPGSGGDANKGKKRTFSEQESGQSTGKSAGDAGVTADSIMDMVKTTGADEPAKQAAAERQAPPSKRVARDDRSASGGGRVAREVYVPAAMRAARGGADAGDAVAAGRGLAAKQDARTDGVRGRGANKFQAAVEEIAPPREPPSAKPEKCLRIEGLKRPFTDKQLKEKLEEASEGEGATWVWLNRIKSLCMCEFSTEEQADTARKAMYDVQWPEVTGGRLIISFITVYAPLSRQCLSPSLFGCHLAIPSPCFLRACALALLHLTLPSPCACHSYCATQREDAEKVVASEPSAKPIGARLGVLPPRQGTDDGHPTFLFSFWDSGFRAGLGSWAHLSLSPSLLIFAPQCDLFFPLFLLIVPFFALHGVFLAPCRSGRSSRGRLK